MKTSNFINTFYICCFTTYLLLPIILSNAYLLSYTDYYMVPVADRATVSPPPPPPPRTRPRPRPPPNPAQFVAASALNNLDLNQIIIFNVGDFVSLENITRSYRQKFDQDAINYCNFDPDLLTSKTTTMINNSPMARSAAYNEQLTMLSKPNFNVNIFLKGGIFNQNSQITSIFGEFAYAIWKFLY